VLTAQVGDPACAGAIKPPDSDSAR
jgi:hypothetical protein